MGQHDDSKKPRDNPFNGAAIIPGNPGNKGGKKGRSGRPPSAVREACRLAFHQRLKVLKDIADGKIEASPADRIRAVDTLGKYGGIQKVEHTGADDAPLIPPGRLTPDAIRTRLGALLSN